MRRFIADFFASSVVMCIATGTLAELPDNYVNALNILIEPDARPTVSNVASGFGASGGQKFLAISYTDQDLQTREPGDDDGSIIIGLIYLSVLSFVSWFVTYLLYKKGYKIKS